MRLPKLRCLWQLRVLLLFAVLLMPHLASSGDFAHDPFTGTCTQLEKYFVEYAKQHLSEDDLKAQGGDPTKGAAGHTTLEWRYGFEYETGPPKKSEATGVCLKPTTLKNIKFWPETKMHRIDWKHNWPRKSQCAQEWIRVAKHAETHERTHVKHANEVAKKVEKEFFKEVAKEFSKNIEDFPPACDSTLQKANEKLGKSLDSFLKPLVDKAVSIAKADFGEKAVELHAGDKIVIDCTKCKSYSFEGLNIHWKVKTSYDNGMEVVTPGEVILESEGTICGNPLETDLGYVLWGVDGRKPNKVRMPWSKYRELQSDPIKAKAESEKSFGFPRFLSTNPPQFEWIVPSDYLNRANPPNSRILDMQLIPATPTATVPAIVSEEPLGCEESASEPKSISSIPQVRKRLTRYTPQPTIGLLRCG